MESKLYIDTLTEDEIHVIEARLRPGKSSSKGFLGSDESLKNIIYEDAKSIEKIGITHEQIADRLDQAVNNRLLSERYTVQSVGYRGWQDNPFENTFSIAPLSSLDFTVTSPSGKHISFPGLIITLIRKYQFFEGKGTNYRLDPLDAISVLNIKPGEDYSFSNRQESDNNYR